MKRKSVIIMLALAVLLLLSSCGGMDWTSDGTELRTSYEGTEFIFEPSWDGNTAEGVVRSVSDFLRVFGLAEGRTVQVCGEDAEPAPEAATLRLEANKAPELTDYWALYQSAKENIPDYGMAYAAVAAVCEARKLCLVEAEHTDAELAKKLAYRDRMYILDLTMPLFDERFIGEKNAALAHETAAALGRFALSGRGEQELLRLIEADEAEKTALKNDWLRSAGASDTYEPFALLAYERSEGEFREDYPYLLRCGDAVWHFASKDVQDEGYADFIRSFLRLEELRPLDFADAREAMREDIDGELQPADIYTAFFEESDYGGQYFPKEKRIKVYHDWIDAHWSLLHEYIHYLRHEHAFSVNPLDKEGITEAVAAFECENRMRQSPYLDETPYDMEEWREIGVWDAEKLHMSFPLYNIWRSLRYYLGHAGRDYYPYRSIGQNEIETPADRHDAMANLSYEEGAAMIWSMFETYGREEVLTHCYDVENMREMWGKSFAEVYKDFGAWLIEQDKINGWGLTD